MRDQDRREMVHVALFGTAGGVLAWLFGFWINDPVRVNVPADAIVSVLLGAGASVVFVFLIANTDRSDVPRLFALALLSGFFWEPVWEGSRALVEHHVQTTRISEARASIQQAQRLAETVEDTEGEERDVQLGRLTQNLQRASSLVGKVDSLSARSTIESEFDDLRSQLAGLRGVRGSSAVRLAAAQLGAQIAPLETSAPFSSSSSVLARETAHLVAAAEVGPPTAPEQLDPEGLPSLAELGVLEIGESKTVNPSEGVRTWWTRIRLGQLHDLLVDIVADDGDLVAAIYEIDSLELEVYDDDSGEGRNPRIAVSLPAGEYILRVSTYGGTDLPDFRITVRANLAPPA